VRFKGILESIEKLSTVEEEIENACFGNHLSMSSENSIRLSLPKEGRNPCNNF